LTEDVAMTDAVRLQLRTAGGYLVVLTGLNLAWELVQLPLYCIWTDAPLSTNLFAVLHCTGGDVLIAATTLTAAVVLAGRRWPGESFWRVAFVATGLGIGYTIFSEWLNVEVRASWAYATAMPRLPWLGTGLSPVLEWTLIPPLSFVLLKSRIAGTRFFDMPQGAGGRRD
jgi:hypothetical protein